MADALPATAMPIKPGAIPSLDGIRALAVGLVFFAHSGLQNRVPGGLGVTIFFVLSGYLITTLMRAEFSKTGTLSFGLFYYRRLLRLMPALLIVTLGAAVLSACALIPGTFTTGGLLSVLFYFGNYFVIVNDFSGIPAGLGIVWSLAVEEHFYLIYPPLALLLLRMTNTRLAATALAGLCVVVLAWRVWLRFHGASDAYVEMATDTRIDAILIGCLMALVCNPWGIRQQPRNTAYDWPIALAAVTVLIGTLVIRNETFRLTLRYLLQSLAIAPLMFLAVARAESRPFRVLNWRPVAYVGSVSYTIYLSHQLILSFVQQQWPAAGWLTTVIATAVLTLAVAEPVRRWVDKPCAALRNRLQKRARVQQDGLKARVAAE